MKLEFDLNCLIAVKNVPLDSHCFLVRVEHRSINLNLDDGILKLVKLSLFFNRFLYECSVCCLGAESLLRKGELWVQKAKGARERTRLEEGRQNSRLLR